MEAQDKGISELQINNIIYEFKTIKRTSKKIRKSINLRWEKLTRIHVDALNQYTERRFQQGFTLWDIRNDLSADSPEMKDVSLSTLSLKLKKKQNLSYRKVG